MGTEARMRARVRADVVRLAQSGLELEEFAGRVRSTLVKAVPFDGACLSTFDPATLLPTSCVAENGLPPEATLRLYELEARAPDVNAFATLARSPSPAAGLAEATRGDLDRCRRHREFRRPNGFGDELRATLQGTTGAWGALTLLRDAARPQFDPTEVEFVASLAAPLADGVRRTALLRDAVAEAAESDAGLLLLAPDDTVESVNRAAEDWLDELGADHHSGAVLPTAVRAVAAQARRTTAGGDDTTMARARVRTRAGRWAVVRGSLLGDGSEARVAILLEPARAAELAPLIADAYGLTKRERRVTELVAQGYPTNEIAARLHLSAYTVQDHLKAIFEKTGTGSRGELMARIFFNHYAPLLSATATADADAEAEARQATGSEATPKRSW